MVMNLVAICLVATSLAASAVWSPAPAATVKHNDDVIVKEGHRVVVVEYDRDGRRNTKVSISGAGDGVSGAFDEISGEVGRKGSAAKELICDAYGKCKEVVSSTLGRAKDRASEMVDDVAETVSGKARVVREGVEEVGETAARKARDAKERAKEKFEGVREGVEEVGETAARKAREAKTQARETLDDVKERAKTKTKEAVRSASEAAERVGEDAAKKVKEAKDTTKDTAKATANWFTNTLRKLMQSQMMTNSVPGLMNLLGFATAYGMCMWVTFISSYILAGSLPRQQFAVVQSKIYPVYFRAMAYSIGTALLGYLLSQRKRLFDHKSEMLQGLNLASSLAMVFFNMVWLEPRATKVMFERMKLEKEEGRGRDLFGGGPLTGAVTVPTGTPTTETAAADTVTTTTTTTTTRDKTTTEEDGEVVKNLVTKLNNRLKSLNAYSSLLNILAQESQCLLVAAEYIDAFGSDVAPSVSEPEARLCSYILLIVLSD